VKFEGGCVCDVQELMPNTPGREARGERCMVHACNEKYAARGVSHAVVPDPR
jgi:hypothetical protein